MNDAQKEGRAFVEDQMRVLRRIRDTLSVTQDVIATAANCHRRALTYMAGDQLLVAFSVKHTNLIIIIIIIIFHMY